MYGKQAISCFMFSDIVYKVFKIINITFMKLCFILFHTISDFCLFRMVRGKKNSGKWTIFSSTIFFSNINKIFEEIHMCCKKIQSVLKCRNQVFLSNSSSRGFLLQYVYTLRLFSLYIYYIYLYICISCAYINICI